MSSYRLIQAGDSDSFPEPHAFTRVASAEGSGLVILGSHAGKSYASLEHAERFDFVAIELGSECLGVHVGESPTPDRSNVVGFARFRLGRGQPSRLVEIVRRPGTTAEALAAARNAFSSADLVPAVCNDFPGRIVNRLIRPFYNAILQRLDEGLASAEDLDKTLCLGLGYPKGPVALLQETGLEHHHDVTARLFAALGQEAYSPARRAQVAHERAKHARQGS